MRENVKRFFDISISSLGLIILSPLLGLTSIAIKLDSKGPVLFKQQRAGKDGKVFTLYKFRTMNNELKDEKGILLPDERRLTRVGKFLRKVSLDELPEIWNVLKGDMSLVGPRPLLAKYLDRYTLEQSRRHEVNPGLTGWAQINGRNTISWEEKFKYDVWYVNNWNFWLDIKILAWTWWKVVKKEGIGRPGHVTMEEFRGDNQEEL